MSSRPSDATWMAADPSRQTLEIRHQFGTSRQPGVSGVRLAQASEPACLAGFLNAQALPGRLRVAFSVSL